MEISEILVLGAGAVGSVFGALLSKKKKVTLVGSKAHVKAIRIQGLSLVGDITQNFRLKAETRVRAVSADTLIILSTKAHDSIRAVKQIKRMLRKDTVMLVLQNGLGNEEIVKDVVGGKVEVLRGLTTIAAELLTPGKIRVWQNTTTLEPGTSAKKIAALFNSCRLETRISENFRSEVWNKLALNCVVNPLTALFNVRNDTVASETLKWVRHEIARECALVAKAEGIAFEMDFEALDRKILGFTNFSSMCQDVARGKKTEIEFLNGKVVELGRQHEILTPVNKTLTSMIKFLEETPVGLRREN